MRTALDIAYGTMLVLVVATELLLVREIRKLRGQLKESDENNQAAMRLAMMLQVGTSLLSTVAIGMVARSSRQGDKGGGGYNGP